MWDFGVVTTCYLYNRNLTPILHGRSPYEALFGRIPEYTKLRVFGSRCYPCLRLYQAHKHDAKSRPCVFVGYSQENDAYLCLEPASRRLFSFRDVCFDEMDFSLNKVFHKDSESKGTENLGEGFSTEYLVSQPPLDNSSLDGAP